MSVTGMVRMRGIVAASILIFLLAALGLTGTALAQSDSTEGPYRLQPGDVVAVSVLEDPELDRQVLLLPDGRISLPVAGTIVAAGQTPAELERTIRSRLRGNFVKAPTITVSVISLAEEDEEEEAETREVFVLGEVASPGRYEYEAETPIDVLKALSLAGGLGPFAARDRIQVRETAEGAAQTLRLFDYDAVEDGLINTSRDLAILADGAVIVVPERGLFD